MVDEVLTSCYASINHDISHLTMMPVRWFPEVTHRIFGEDNGYSAFISIGEQLGKWFLSYGQLW